MPHLSTPNVNFLPSEPREFTQFLDPRISAAFWDMETLNDVAIRSGYDGIQLHDGRFLHVQQLKFGSDEYVAHAGRHIQSMHEGWRGPVDPRLPGSKGRILEKLGSAVLFPAAERTLKNLETIEHKLGRKVPYVGFPTVGNNLEADQAKAKRLGEVRIQPNADMADNWTVAHIGSFAFQKGSLPGAIKTRGFKVAYDSGHGNRKGRYASEPMYSGTYLKPLLDSGLVDEIHASVFRYDLAHVDKACADTTTFEGKALLGMDGYELKDTPLGKIFAALREKQWEGDVTLEAPLTGITKAIGSIASKAQIISIHSRMTARIRKELPHINWDEPAAA